MTESDDRMDFWWDDESQQYVEGSRYGPISRSKEPKMSEYVASTKKTLDDMGTRFGHLADFQDYLSDGLVVVGNSLARYKNESDVERQKSLEAAVALLKVYQYNMAGYDQKKWGFNQMLDSCAPSAATLAEIKIDRLKAAESAKTKTEPSA